MEYSIKKSTRARYVRLAVQPDGAVVVTAPRFFGAGAIERFVQSHAGWIQKHIARTKDRHVIRIRRSDIPQLKKKALVLAEDRCKEIAAAYGFAYAKITIRAQKKRWGSCSLTGNLSFNYKIAALPPHIAEYIIVHEICHLGAFDHSKKFWNLVARLVPDHKAIRADLRKTAFIFE